MELLSDLRLCCLQVTFQLIINKVNALSRVESWVLEITDGEGAVTKLPNEFMAIANNSVAAIKEVTSQANDHEHDVLADPEVVTSFKELLLNAMSSFAFTLEYTAVDDEGPPPDHDDDEDGVTPRATAASTPCDAVKLLVCMNNCEYTLTQVLPKISALYQSMFENISMAEPHEGAASSYEILRQKLLETYIDQKVEPIVAIIEPSMYSGKFDWARCPKPKDAKDYGKLLYHLFSDLIQAFFTTFVKTQGKKLPKINNSRQFLPKNSTNR